MTPPSRLPSAERAIFFYRLDAGLDDDGVPIDVDLEPTLRRINGLPFRMGGRYIPGDPDSFTSCWVDGFTPRPRMRLATIRRSGLPQLEETGNLKPLLIGPTEGVAEQIHVVLFRDVTDGIGMTIAGSEFNSYGPRVSRLAAYLRRQAPRRLPILTFRPLLRRDVTEALDHLSDITFFRLRIQPSYLEQISQGSRSLGAAFQAAANVGEATEYEIAAQVQSRARPGRVAPRRRQGSSHIDPEYLGIARRMAAREDLRSGATSFEVRGHAEATGHIEALDLLSDKLIVRKQILREDEASRALNSEAAFGAIEAAYLELQPELVMAATAILAPVADSDE